MRLALEGCADFAGSAPPGSPLMTNSIRRNRSSPWTLNYTRLRPVWQLSRDNGSARSRSPIIHPMQTKNLLIFWLGLLVAIGQATPYASAGETTVLGGYAITAHWRDDPVRVQRGNAIILEFTVVDQSAAHLKPTDFDFAVIEDGSRTALAITVDENGVISAPFTPTTAGRASVVVSGSIDGVEESVAEVDPKNWRRICG